VLAEVPIVPIDPLVALEVRPVSVTLPTEVLDLVDYSSSDSDPSEDSLPPALELPLVSPFLCFDDSEVDSGGTGSHWPSSPSGSSPHEKFTPSSKFPIAHVVVPPGIRRRPLILIQPGEAIPFNFTLGSSSFGSSLDSSSDTSSCSPLESLSDTSLVHSSGCNASGQTHSGPSTRVASSRKEHMKIDAADVEVVVDLGIGDGVDTEDGICIGVEIAASDIREDEEEFKAEASVGGMIKITLDSLVTRGIFESTRGDVPDLEDTLYDTVHYMLERVAEALANYEATRAANAFETESQSQNVNDRDNGNGGNRNENHADGGNNKNRNPNENGRGAILVARVYTYQDFMKCQPLNFKGTKGVVGVIYVSIFTIYFMPTIPKNNTLKGSVPGRMEFHEGFQPERLA
nr:hypothetical protein [Tanacetum cinerariifolium]